MAGSRILRGQDVPLAPLSLAPLRRTFRAEPEPGPVSTSATPGASCGEDEVRQELHRIQSSLPSIRSEAYKKGVEEGEKRAAAAIAEFEAMNTNLAEAISDAVALKSELRRSVQKNVLDLSLAIARRILHREVHVDAHALEGIIAAALQRVGHQDLIVKTSPGHANSVRDCLNSLLPGNGIELVADPALAMGSVVFELARGTMDASVDAQLDEIRRGLTDCLAARRP